MVKKLIYIFQFVALALVNMACLDSFLPESKDFDDLLVVEGKITDLPESNLIRISRSRPLNEPAADFPVQNAVVRIVEDGTSGHQLSEVSPGLYTTNSDVFKGRVGAEYVLHIFLPEKQKNYISKPVRIRQTPPIENLYFEFKEQFVGGAEAPVQGYDIFLDTSDPLGNSKFYRWEYHETWMVNAFFNSYLEFVDNEIRSRTVDISVCYPTSRSTQLLLGTSLNLSEDKIRRQRLAYIDNRTRRLSMAYTMLVRQYVLSPESYEYHRQLQQITENMGTLFDPQPFELVGNMVCEEDPDERVLGYFDAVSVAEKRLWIRRSDVLDFRIPGASFCQADTVPLSGVGEHIRLNFSEVFGEFMPGIYLLAPRSCVDCRNFGPAIRPDYWE
ncbi:MAG: DUF4249 domain-containing protein [Cyclobacteriaceae bacterium]|nr:DUF4249 domain-containing protein [Cyclobacteriaceae bacterium]